MTYKDLGYIIYTRYRPYTSKSRIFTIKDSDLPSFYLCQILAHKRLLSQEWLSRERAIWIHGRIWSLKAALRRLIKDNSTVDVKKLEAQE